MTLPTIKVTEEDVSAAVGLKYALDEIGSTSWSVRVTIPGEHPVVKAFAAHRLSGYNQGVAEERERCARLAEAAAEKCEPYARGIGTAAITERGRKLEATEIATAIRSGEA